MESRNSTGRGAAWRGFSDEIRGPLSTSGNVAQASMAILPVGATEQHGDVLPLGMDWIAVTEIAHEVAKTLDAYLLPTLPIGTSMEHRGSAGTVWLRPATLAHTIIDIADSLSVWGMTRLAIISGHGGNFILGPTVRQLNTEHPDRKVILVPESVKLEHSTADDLHVGAHETSLGCHLVGAVAPGPDADFVPNVARDELNHKPLLELSPSGVWGNPSHATPEQGEKEFKSRIARITSYLRKVAL